jgi:putative ABC transport system substrate-binding protein
MNKKSLVSMLAVVIVVFVHLAEAQQQKKVPRIGYLSSTDDPKTPGPSIEAFRQGLRDLGYIEGKNILVEYRYAEGMSDRMPAQPSKRPRRFPLSW